MTAPDLSRLPAGAKRALMAMTEEWQFAGKATCSRADAEAGCREHLLEWQLASKGRDVSIVYRLTPAGLCARDALKEHDNER